MINIKTNFDYYLKPNLILLMEIPSSID